MRITGNIVNKFSTLVNRLKPGTVKHVDSSIFRQINKTEFANVTPVDYRQLLKLPNKMELYKNECVNAIKSKNPYEKLIAINAETKDVITRVNGDALGCEINPKVLGKQPVIILHGHPEVKEGVTLPVSFQDFILMNENPQVKEIVAYNVNGEKSVLRKLEDYTPLTKKQIHGWKYAYMHTIKNAHTENYFERAKLAQLIEYYKQHPDADMVAQSIAETFTKMQYSKGGAEAINGFWTKYAEMLHLQYVPFK